MLDELLKDHDGQFSPLKRLLFLVNEGGDRLKRSKGGWLESWSLISGLVSEMQLRAEEANFFGSPVELEHVSRSWNEGSVDRLGKSMLLQREPEDCDKRILKFSIDDLSMEEPFTRRATRMKSVKWDDISQLFDRWSRYLESIEDEGGSNTEWTRLMTKKEIEEELEISPQTRRNYIRDGKLIVDQENKNAKSCRVSLKSFNQLKRKD